MSCQPTPTPSCGAFALHSASSWDGLVVQAALDAGCAKLYTEDMQAGQRFDDLEVVNPFAGEAHQPRAMYAAVKAAGKRRTAPARRGKS
jgi:predicted phosphoadenosine phosphosulfate sulfurtransferase